MTSSARTPVGYSQGPITYSGDEILQTTENPVQKPLLPDIKKYHKRALINEWFGGVLFHSLDLQEPPLAYPRADFQRNNWCQAQCNLHSSMLEKPP
jgi:hypothetical protein